MPKINKKWDRVFYKYKKYILFIKNIVKSGQFDFIVLKYILCVSINMK